MPVNINLIWAQSQNRIIGNHGVMPWHLPEDLVHFKKMTNGSPVIMGRKTWDSLPERFRPLPGRLNIVLTRQPHWGNGHELVRKTNSIEAAITPQITGPGVKDVWIIGGGQIYAQYLPRASRIEITHIFSDYEGDTPSPTLNEDWKEIRRIENTSSEGVRFDFVSYVRATGKVGQYSLLF